MDATFDLSLNIIPEDMTVNACDHFRLEQMCKSLAKDFSKLFVLTGPAFVPNSSTSSSSNSKEKVKQMSYEVIGDREVAVPTHFFKCLLGQDLSNANNFALGCFLMQNAPIPVEQPLTSFEVPVEELERITGISIFKEVRYNKGWYKLCTKHKCEGSYGSFSKNFRQIGVLRACKSKQELNEKWTAIQREYDTSGAAIESSLAKEYQNRLKNFA
jgi:DNA/RNA endonuclease G (NUC1)